MKILSKSKLTVQVPTQMRLLMKKTGNCTLGLAMVNIIFIIIRRKFYSLFPILVPLYLFLTDQLCNEHYINTCIMHLLLFFIITNMCTVNTIRVYITTISLCCLYCYMCWQFDVLLTVHLSIFISVINQLDAQNFCFTISLFHPSTCFEHKCSSSGGQNCITQPLVSSNLGVMIPEAV